MEAKTKHLEFIQATINRMANNSFLLKGWSITIVGGILAISFKEVDCRYLYIALAILTFFWLLDGYYLWRERLFVKLYNDARKKKEGEVDFSMDIKEFEQEGGWSDCMFSLTLLLFYGGLGAVLSFISIYIL